MMTKRQVSPSPTQIYVPFKAVFISRLNKLFGLLSKPVSGLRHSVHGGLTWRRRTRVSEFRGQEEECDGHFNDEGSVCDRYASLLLGGNISYL